MSYLELQSLPEIPSIAYFCSLFQNTLGTPDFEIQELEDALVLGTNADSQDMFSASFLDDLVVSLLRGCLPMYSSVINNNNYTTYLRQLIQTKIEEHEEEDWTGPSEIASPFEDDDTLFSELNIKEKVVVLSQLTQFRLEADDVPNKIKSVPVESLRLDPLGVDSDGVIYWYFYGTRLYKEVKKKRQEKKSKPTDKNDNGKKKKKKAEAVEKGDVGAGPVEAPGWRVACQTEADWNTLSESLRRSKKKVDKELLAIIEENFLPDVVKMFQDQEREQHLKILMMNKRVSKRQDYKRQAQEEEEARAAEEQRRLTEIRQKEEELRAVKEKEKALIAREQRARLREEKERAQRLNRRHGERGKAVADEVSSWHGSSSEEEDDENKEKKRKKTKTAKKGKYTEESSGSSSEEEEGENEEEERRRKTAPKNEKKGKKVPVKEKETRLESELRRRVERDHDYLPEWRSGTRRGSRPAAKEWGRLQDDDSQQVRSIRF